VYYRLNLLNEFLPLVDKSINTKPIIQIILFRGPGSLVGLDRLFAPNGELTNSATSIRQGEWIA